MRRLPFLNIPLWLQIFVALILGFGLGSILGESAAPWGTKWADLIGILGTLFLKLLQMIVVPLIATAVITALLNLGQERRFGQLLKATLLWFLTTTLIAAITGWAIVGILQPGIHQGNPSAAHLGIASETQDAASIAQGRSLSDFGNVILRMIPYNIFAAASDNSQMLAIIFFASFFGYALAVSHKSKSILSLQESIEGFHAVMLRITHSIIALAPLGVLGIIVKSSAEMDWAAVAVLGKYVVTVVSALLIHAFLTLPLLYFFITRSNPFQLYREIAPALLTAFTTSSSNAALPITIDCLERKSNVHPKVAGFVAPLGATINMNGTALYECVVVLFLAQTLGIELSIFAQIMTIGLALLTSIGVAGVPAASLVAIVVILQALGLPQEAVGIILVVDRPLDMLRTAANVLGDAVTAKIIHHRFFPAA